MILKLKYFFTFIVILVLSGCQKEQNEPYFQKTCDLTKSDDASTRLASSNYDRIVEKFFNVKLIPLDPSKIKKLSRDIQPRENENDYSVNGVFDFYSAKSSDLGMNNVPVLDQGSYGTCVTFASIAAVDAVLGIGDFISPQCSLMLDRALGYNFWDGAFEASQIIYPLQQYGVVSNKHCPYEYPSRYARISLDDYVKLAHQKVSLERIQHRYIYPIELSHIKGAISRGHRVLLGFGILTSSDRHSIGGFDLKVNCKEKIGGLWACQQPGSTKDYCRTMTMGHEAIVVGYDDNQQILKLRNSWGSDVGDNGDFYMTYQFFNAMAIDGTEIY